MLKSLSVVCFWSMSLSGLKTLFLSINLTTAEVLNSSVKTQENVRHSDLMIEKGHISYHVPLCTRSAQ